MTNHPSRSLRTPVRPEPSSSGGRLLANTRTGDEVSTSGQPPTAKPESRPAVSRPILSSGVWSFRILAILLWAACTLPTTLLLFQTARVFGETTAYTPETQTLRYALIGAVSAWALVIINRRVADLASRPFGVFIVLAIATFYPAAAAYFHGGGSMDELLTAAVSLLIVLALFSVSVTWEDLSIVGALGAATGAVSLGMAQLRPESAFVLEEGGRALAGPFNNSNYLGTVLVLSLPFALLIRKRLHRALACVLIVWPILMGGSTTGIATLAVFAALGIVLLVGTTPSFRGSLLGVASVVALAAMMLLPMVVSDERSLTGRGAIWLYARNNVNDFIPFGAGREWFTENSLAIGFQAHHGHHLLLDPLIVGGLPFAGVVFILMLMLIRSGVRAAGSGDTIAPAMFAVTLVLAGGLGNFFILDLRDLRYTATGFVIIAILSITTRRTAQGSPGGESATPRLKRT